MLILAVTLAVLVVTAVSGTTSTVEPSIVTGMVTSTITASPTDSLSNAVDLEVRQLDWTSSAPAWTESAPVWTELPNTWAEQSWVYGNQPTGIPKYPTISPVAPTVVVTPAPSASPTYTYEETHRDNKKETVAHEVIAGVAIGSILAVGFLGALITLICRKCAARKKNGPMSAPDIEMTAGVANDGSSSRVTSSHTDKSFQNTPVYARDFVQPPKMTHYPPQQIHWPPEDIPVQTVHSSRGQGYRRTG